MAVTRPRLRRSEEVSQDLERTMEPDREPRSSIQPVEYSLSIAVMVSHNLMQLPTYHREVNTSGNTNVPVIEGYSRSDTSTQLCSSESRCRYRQAGRCTSKGTKLNIEVDLGYSLYRWRIDNLLSDTDQDKRYTTSDTDPDKRYRPGQAIPTTTSVLLKPIRVREVATTYM
jgi:hypothetical protein